MSAALSVDARARRLFGVLPEPAQPFAAIEAAVIWMMQALDARQNGRAVPRAVCEPDDICKSIDRLYRQRTLQLSHARILGIWGQRGRAPCPHDNRADRRLWDEAMRALDAPLRLRGIVR